MGNSSSTTLVDPFICVGIAILVIVTCVINTYIYAYWQHPDDPVETRVEIPEHDKKKQSCLRSVLQSTSPRHKQLVEDVF